MTLKQIIYSVLTAMVWCTGSLWATEAAPGSGPLPEDFEALWKAAREGDCATIQRSLQAKTPVDAPDKNHNGDTAMIHAARFGHPDAVKILLQSGAKVDQRNFCGGTALLGCIIWACGNNADQNHISCIEALLAAGADPNLSWSDGQSPLAIAATRDTPILEALLEAHPNLNAVNSIGQSALIEAAAAGKIENVKLLVGAGADVNLENSFGETALTAALRKGISEEIELLKNSGARKQEPTSRKYLHTYPGLSAAQTWALATTAMMQELESDPSFEREATLKAESDPLKPCWTPMDIKSKLAQTPFYLIYGGLRWTGMPNEAITDPTGLDLWLSNCERVGDRAQFKRKPRKIAQQNPVEPKKPEKIDPFEAAFHRPTPERRVGALHEDPKYLAWDLCNYIWVVRSGYAAGFISKEAAWKKILAAAQRIQSNFSSWEEMANDFQNGLEQKRGKPDDRFKYIYRMLLNPADQNSPWAVLSWTTPLAIPG